MKERSRELATSWIEAWARMDLRWLRENLASDFVHVSPFGRLEGREHYLATVEPMARKSVVQLVVKQVVATGNQAAVWFENRTSKGVVESCDWVRVESGEIMFLLGACSSQEGRRGTAETPEAQIQAASRAFSDAYVRGDTTAIRDLYTEDAVLLQPGREVRGSAHIARYFAPGPNRTQVRHGMTSSELKVVGDLAVDIGTWSSTWRTGDAEEQAASERYLIVWRRGKDGRWRIEYDMWHRPAR